MNMEMRVIRRESADKVILEKINEEAIPENERNSLDDLFASGQPEVFFYQKNQKSHVSSQQRNDHGKYQ